MFDTVISNTAWINVCMYNIQYKHYIPQILLVSVAVSAAISLLHLQITLRSKNIGHYKYSPHIHFNEKKNHDYHHTIVGVWRY